MRNSDSLGVDNIGIALLLLVRILVTAKDVLAEPRTSQKVIQEQQALGKEYHKSDSLSTAPSMEWKPRRIT